MKPIHKPFTVPAHNNAELILYSLTISRIIDVTVANNPSSFMRVTSFHIGDIRAAILSIKPLDLEHGASRIRHIEQRRIHI